MAIVDWKKVLRDEGVNRAGLTSQLLARQLGITLDEKVIGYKDSAGNMSFYTPEGGDATYNTLQITGLANSGTLVADANGNVSVSTVGTTNRLVSQWNYLDGSSGAGIFNMDLVNKTISINATSVNGDYSDTMRLLFEFSSITVQDSNNSNNFKIIDIRNEGTLVGDIWTFPYEILRESGVDFTNQLCTLIFDVVSGMTQLGEQPYIDFIPQVEPDPDYKEARTFYNANEHSVQVHTNNEDYDFIVGQARFQRGRNETGTTINKFKVVDFHDGSSDGIGIQIHVADAVNDANKSEEGWALGVATEDILDDEYGTVAFEGTIRNVDTSSLIPGEPAYLGTNGNITNDRPNYPAESVLVGTCVFQDAINGVFAVFVQKDNYDFEFDATILERQNTTIVTDGISVWMDVTNVEDPTRDLPIQISGSIYQLNTTSGSGVGGAARVELLQGTAILPLRQQVYVDVTSGAAVLKTTAGYPAPPFAGIATAAITTAALVNTTDKDGIVLHRRQTTSKAHDSRGRISYISERLFIESPKWWSGCTPTAVINTGPTPDVMDMTSIAGIVYQTHRQDWPELSVVADGIYVGNGVGGDSLDNLTKVNNLWDVMGYTSDPAKTRVTASRGNLVVWGAINKDTSECKLFVNLPNDLYGAPGNQADNCYFDVDGTADYAVADESRLTAFLIARIPYEIDGNSIFFSNPTGKEDIINLLGNPIGIAGGAAGGGGAFIPNLTQVLGEGNDAGNIGIVDLPYVSGDGSYINLADVMTIQASDKVKIGADIGSANMEVDQQLVTINDPSPAQADIKGKLQIKVDTGSTGDLTITGTEEGTGPGGIGNADGVYTYIGTTAGQMDDIYQRGTDNVFIGNVTAIWIITNNLAPGIWTDCSYYLTSLDPIGTYIPYASGLSAFPVVSEGGSVLGSNAIHTNGDIVFEGAMYSGKSAQIGEDQTTRPVAEQELITKKYLDEVAITNPNGDIIQSNAFRIPRVSGLGDGELLADVGMQLGHYPGDDTAYITAEFEGPNIIRFGDINQPIVEVAGVQVYLGSDKDHATDAYIKMDSTNSTSDNIAELHNIIIDNGSADSLVTKGWVEASIAGSESQGDLGNLNVADGSGGWLQALESDTGATLSAVDYGYALLGLKVDGCNFKLSSTDVMRYQAYDGGSSSTADAHDWYNNNTSIMTLDYAGQKLNLPQSTQATNTPADKDLLTKEGADALYGGGGQVDGVSAGKGITVDNADPEYPIVHAWEKTWEGAPVQILGKYYAIAGRSTLSGNAPSSAASIYFEGGWNQTGTAQFDYTYERVINDYAQKEREEIRIKNMVSRWINGDVKFAIIHDGVYSYAAIEIPADKATQSVTIWMRDPQEFNKTTVIPNDNPAIRDTRDLIRYTTENGTLRVPITNESFSGGSTYPFDAFINGAREGDMVLACFNKTYLDSVANDVRPDVAGWVDSDNKIKLEAKVNNYSIVPAGSEIYVTVIPMGGIEVSY